MAFCAVIYETLFVDQADIKAFADNWLNCYVEKAIPTYPADGIESVSCGIKLKWTDTAELYDVYFGTNASEPQNADITSSQYMLTTSDNFYAPPQLSADTAYYWRIDAAKGGCTVKSDVYSFKTTSQKTLAYWELDTDGSSAVGKYSFRPELAAPTPDASYYCIIAKPDSTSTWNSAGNSADNGSSLYFDGQSVLVNNVPDSPFRFRRSVAFTCEAYIKPTELNSANGIIFGTRDAFSGYTGWQLRYDSTYQRLSFNIDHPAGSSSAYSASASFGIGQSKHIALVWDPAAGANGQIRAYLDGAPVITANGQDYWDDSNGCGWNFMIGGRNLAENPWCFKGNIDELRWSNYALEPSEFLNAQNQ